MQTRNMVQRSRIACIWSCAWVHSCVICVCIECNMICCDAVCCSVLQCVTWVAFNRNWKSHATRRRKVQRGHRRRPSSNRHRQYTAKHCITLQYSAADAYTIEHTASQTHYDKQGGFYQIVVSNTLQHSATYCNTLQQTATHCNTRERLRLIV